jgi:hypothetical protein
VKLARRASVASRPPDDEREHGERADHREHANRGRAHRSEREQRRTDEHARGPGGLAKCRDRTFRIARTEAAGHDQLDQPCEREPGDLRTRRVCELQDRRNPLRGCDREPADEPGHEIARRVATRGEHDREHECIDEHPELAREPDEPDEYSERDRRARPAAPIRRICEPRRGRADPGQVRDRRQRPAHRSACEAPGGRVEEAGTKRAARLAAIAAAPRRRLPVPPR